MYYSRNNKNNNSYNIMCTMDVHKQLITIDNNVYECVVII